MGAKSVSNTLHKAELFTYSPEFVKTIDLRPVPLIMERTMANLHTPI